MPRFPDVIVKGLTVSSMTHEEFKTILCASADEAFRLMKYMYGVDRENPVEVWTRTSDILDAIIRRKLKSKLIAEGRNPFTGRVEKNDHRRFYYLRQKK